MTNGDVTIDYQYNSDGIRTKKTVTTSGDHVHSFQSNVVAPTCTENGYTLHSCSCGYIYQDAPVAATGHNFTTTVVGTNCTEVGHTVHSCSCGYSYEEGANGHNFTTLVVEPTETINGFTLHECDCGYSYESDPVASLGSATAASEDAVSDTKVYDYVYNGSSLVYLTITTTEYSESPVVETLYFGNGTVTYNDVVYYYVTNLQGDVIAILDDEGNAVVEYTYDAWGKLLTTTGSMASTLGAANPLTYRGYVYDTESGLYYLQSRYYSSNVGRFLNADALVSTGQGLLGNNMFAYCNNNPANFKDSSGKIPDSFAGQFGQLLGEFLYELLTGDDHPSNETESVERTIIEKQNELVGRPGKAMWKAWVHTQELQVEQKYNQDMTIKREVESWGDNPVRGMDFATMTTSNILTYAGYVSFVLGPTVGGGASLLIGAICGIWTTLRYFEVIS